MILHFPPPEILIFSPIRGVLVTIVTPLGAIKEAKKRADAPPPMTISSSGLIIISLLHVGSNEYMHNQL